MHPILASLGPLHLYSYGLLVGIGIVAAIQLLRMLAKKSGLSPDTIVDLALVTVAAGFAGARIFYVIQFWDHFRMSPLGVFKIWEGGLVLYGGLAGGLFGFFVFVRAKRLPFLACLDLFVIAAALAQGFGRLGCFLNGCCFGHKTQLPFGVSFPFLDYRVHPTQIYESLFCFGLAGLLIGLRRRKFREGAVAAAYFLIYALGRFSIEFFRGDNVKLALNLTLAQWISAALILVSAFALVYGKQTNRRPS